MFSIGKISNSKTYYFIFYPKVVYLSSDFNDNLYFYLNSGADLSGI